MMPLIPLLEIEDLSIAFGQGARAATVVERASFAIGAHQTVALVGESGSGKSVTAMAIMRLLPEPGRVAAGEIRINRLDLAHLSQREMAQNPRDPIALGFHETRASLQP